MKNIRNPLILLAGALLAGCGGAEPVDANRYRGSDALFTQVLANVERSETLQPIVEIDHSRMGHDAGSPMPPSRVLIFSQPELEAALIAENPLVALDLPLRALVYEAGENGESRLAYNSFDYIASRYGLDGDQLEQQEDDYASAMSEALSGIPESALSTFANDTMVPDGIITLESPYGFDETIERVNEAINAQDDTVHFGVVDFQARAREVGVELAPSHMILFGGPAPGAKAMAGSPTLGLDGFCQKFLIWQDEAGNTYLSFNDLIALAERQDVPVALALRVVNYRLNSVFGDALAPQ